MPISLTERGGFERYTRRRVLDERRGQAWGRFTDPKASPAQQNEAIRSLNDLSSETMAMDRDADDRLFAPIFRLLAEPHPQPADPLERLAGLLGLGPKPS